MPIEPAPLSSPAEAIVRRIRVRLAMLGRSRNHLADALGVSHGALANYLSLRGKAVNPLVWGVNGGKVSLESIAEALGCDAEDLINGPLPGWPPAES